MAAKEDSTEISRMLTSIPELSKIFYVKEKVGEGTFSKVYRAQVKSSSTSAKEYALKYLVPTSRPSRIASELLCLKEVGGSHNIVGVELCLMHQGHVVIVMPYFPHQRFVDYVKYLTTEEMRDYMTNLFLALEKIHACGIIHRDIKPNNFLYDRVKKKYALVDFGLAQRVPEVQTLSTNSTQPSKDAASCQIVQVKCGEIIGFPNASTSAKCLQTAVLDPKKRLAEFDQENNANPSKKKKLDEVAESPDMSRTMSSKAGILPTPPHTPTNHLQMPQQQLPPHQQIPQFVADTKKGPKCATKPEPAIRKPRVTKARQCPCFGKNVVCKLCLGRTVEEAPRGGTPGFRSPEVLLKHQDQTTAVDMWSAGVILLSMLSRKYPFFRAEDDLSSLAEMILLVGQEEMQNAAHNIGKSVLFNLPGFAEVTKMRKHLTPSMYLKRVCSMFALSICSDDYGGSIPNSPSSPTMKSLQAHQAIPSSAYDLLNRLMDPSPSTRITAADALKHPFIKGCS